MRRRYAIEVGQYYREPRPGYLGQPAPLWVVETVFTTPVDTLGYARIACVADRSIRKALSVAILADRRRFVPVAPGQAPPVRRRPDHSAG